MHMHFREHFICRSFFCDVGHEMTFGWNFTGAETEAPAICSASQQSESAKLMVKALCAEAVPKVHTRTKNLNNTLQTENRNSPRTAGNGIQADIWQLETERQCKRLLLLVEQCSRAHREPEVTLPNPLLGSAQAVSLCAVLASCTGKSKTFVVN